MADMTIKANYPRPDSQNKGGAGKYMFVLPWGLEHIGGVNQVVNNLYEEIEKRSGEREPMLLVSDWGKRRPECSQEAGKCTWRLRLRPPVGKPLSRFLVSYLIRLPAELIQKRMFLKRNNVQVINAHYPGYYLFTFALLRRMGVFRGRLIVSLHGKDLRDARQEQGVRRLVWRWIIGWSDAVVACSKGLLDEAVSTGWITRGQGHVVYNGVECERLEREMERSELPSSLKGTAYIAAIGTYEHKKGHDVLLQAFARLRPRWPRLQLVVAGRAGDTLEDCKALARRLDIEDRSHLLVDRSHGEALRIMDGALAVVLPSRNEGFAVVLLEAGALGKAVVATDVCGVSELINDGEDGRLVPSDKPEALAEAIEAILGNNDQRNAMGRKLQERIRSEFSWGRAAEAYLAIARGPQGIDRNWR